MQDTIQLHGTLTSEDTYYDMAKHLIELHGVDKMSETDILDAETKSQHKFLSFFLKHVKYDEYQKWLETQKELKSILWVMFVRAITPISHFKSPVDKKNYIRSATIDIHKRLFFIYLTEVGLLNPKDESHLGFED